MKEKALKLIKADLETTIKQISEIDPKEVKKKENKAIIKRRQQLLDLRTAVELGNPTPENIDRDIANTGLKIERAMEGWEEWAGRKSQQKSKTKPSMASFKTHSGVKRLEHQLAHLELLKKYYDEAKHTD